MRTFQVLCTVPSCNILVFIRFWVEPICSISYLVKNEIIQFVFFLYHSLQISTFRARDVPTYVSLLSAKRNQWQGFFLCDLNYSVGLSPDATACLSGLAIQSRAFWWVGLCDLVLVLVLVLRLRPWYRADPASQNRYRINFPRSSCNIHSFRYLLKNKRLVPARYFFLSK